MDSLGKPAIQIYRSSKCMVEVGGANFCWGQRGHPMSLQRQWSYSFSTIGPDSPHVHMTCLPMGLGCSGSLEPTAYRVPISILVHFGSKSSAATERLRFRHDLRLACEMYVIFNPLVSLFKLWTSLQRWASCHVHLLAPSQAKHSSLRHGEGLQRG